MIEKHREYNILLAFLIGCFIAVLFSVAIWLEPASGDLTRLGGYSENSFGWRAPQERFSKQLFNRDVYDHYYDIVVFGDSFSYKNPGEQTDPGSYWQNFFVNRTGLSLVTFDLNKTDINEVISSPTFQKNPPAIFIYASVERDTIWIPQYVGLDKQDSKCSIDTPSPRIGPLPISISNLEPIPFDRSAVFYHIESDFPLLNLGYAANYLKKAIMRHILRIDSTPVVGIELTRKDLFSSNRPDKLLIYENELLKKHWTQTQIDTTRCALMDLQNMVQGKGKTFFSLMLIPDKITAYSSFIELPHYSNLSKINLFESEGLHLARVDKNIKDAINSGVKDVYLPNDTHWGVAGHKITSDFIFDYLMGMGLLRRNSASH